MMILFHMPVTIWIPLFWYASLNLVHLKVDYFTLISTWIYSESKPDICNKISSPSLWSAYFNFLMMSTDEKFLNFGNSYCSSGQDLALSTVWAWAQSLVGELQPRELHSMAKKKNKKKPHKPKTLYISKKSNFSTFLW